MGTQVQRRIGLDTVVVSDHTRVHQLAFVLVDTLDLHIDGAFGLATTFRCSASQTDSRFLFNSSYARRFT